MRPFSTEQEFLPYCALSFLGLLGGLLSSFEAAMSNEASKIYHRVPPAERPNITLPNGKVLTPRAKLAGEIGIVDKTIARMGLPTKYIGGVAYVDRDRALSEIGK